MCTYVPAVRDSTSEITDQIHELILEDSRISAISIAERLGVSRERGLSFVKIWTCL
jgi:DNA-binding Lrp family transcriptional regulator